MMTGWENDWGNDRRRRRLSQDETRLWRDVMKGVAPLPGQSLPEPDAEPPVPDLAPLPTRGGQDFVSRPREIEAPALRSLPVRLDHGKTAGVDRRTADRMKKGDMSIDGRIDLHGLMQDAAHGTLRSFIVSSFDMGRRCVLVITGKGNREGAGVLRREVPRWLNEPSLRPFVLAFSYAQLRHGGEGALYVLLKRRR